MVLLHESDNCFVVRSRVYPKRLKNERKKDLIVRLHKLKYERGLSRDFTFFGAGPKAMMRPLKSPLVCRLSPTMRGKVVAKTGRSMTHSQDTESSCAAWRLESKRAASRNCPWKIWMGTTVQGGVGGTSCAGI